MKHIDLVNATLALRYQQPGWPALLARFHYLVHGVGVAFKLRTGAEVSPDVLTSADARDVTLMFEAKSGSNLDYAQLGRMESVTPEDLRDFAHLRISRPTQHKVGIVYICNQSDFAALVTAIEGRRATVLGFDGRRFSIGGSPLPDAELANALATAKVEGDAPPLAIIPFDQHSSLGEVARAVLPVIVMNLVRGSGAVTPEGVLQRTHHVCLDVMRSTGAGSEFDQIKRRVVEVLRDAGQNGMSQWLERVERQQVWRLTGALPEDAASRTRELQKLRRAAHDLLVRLGTPGGIQLELFDALDDPQHEPES